MEMCVNAKNERATRFLQINMIIRLIYDYIQFVSLSFYRFVLKAFDGHLKGDQIAARTNCRFSVLMGTGCWW